MIERELDNVREKPTEYRAALLNLTVEAAVAVGTHKVAISYTDNDLKLADRKFAEDAVAAVSEILKTDIKVEVRADPALSGGGCVATSEDGRIVFDNTFKRRLERMKPALRSVIVREVLKAND